MHRGGRRVLLVVALALVAIGATASLAHADDSQLKIKEVYSDGNATNTPAGHGDYVELQLSQPGQFIGDGHSVVVYNAAGTASLVFTFGPDAANILTDNQRTILLGWPGNPTADFVPSGSFVNPQPIGGAVCLVQQVSPVVPIDCMSWGSFPVGTSIALGAGTPGPALPAGGIEALTRSSSANCPTLLEPADDTNDSAADFSLATPSPRNNGTTPTETPCPAPVTPPTTTKKKCKKKKKHHSSAVVAKKKCKKKKR